MHENAQWDPFDEERAWTDPGASTPVWNWANTDPVDPIDPVDPVDPVDPPAPVQTAFDVYVDSGSFGVDPMGKFFNKVLRPMVKDSGTASAPEVSDLKTVQFDRDQNLLTHKFAGSEGLDSLSDPMKAFYKDYYHVPGSQGHSFTEMFERTTRYQIPYAGLRDGFSGTVRRLVNDSDLQVVAMERRQYHVGGRFVELAGWGEHSYFGLSYEFTSGNHDEAGAFLRGFATDFGAGFGRHLERGDGGRRIRRFVGVHGRVGKSGDQLRLERRNGRRDH